MNGKIVIGITGKAAAGKGAAASFLEGFTEIGFADPMYAGVVAMTGVEESWLRDRKRKEMPIPHLGKSPRQLLQTLGTEWGRLMVHPEIWLMQAARRIHAIDGNVVLTDLRFDNEAEMLKEEFGAVIWKVERPGAATCVGHTSEAGISPRYIDHIIGNWGSLDDLRKGVERAQNATLKVTTEGASSDRRACRTP